MEHTHRDTKVIQPPKHSSFRKWLPLMVIAMALFIVVLDTTILNVSIKAVIGDLDSNLKAVQWVITGYSLVLAAFTITGGRLGDIFGRKRLFVIGAIIFALGSAIASQAHSVSELLLGAALVEGFGAALMLPATASLLLSTYQGKDRALAFGVFGAIAGSAATVGPILGGWLTTNYSWRWSYLINPVVVLLVLGGVRFIKEAREKRPHTPDVLSIDLSALGLAAIVYGIIESSTYGWMVAKTDYELGIRHLSLGGISISAYAIIFGIIMLGLFLWRQVQLERKGRVALVSPSMLKNRAFMSGTVVTLVFAMAQFGMIFLLPVFLQGALGKDAFHAGLAILPFSLSVLLGAPIAGILAGKRNVPQKYLIQAGLAISLVGAFLLRSEFSVDTTVTTLIPGLIVFGFGFGLAFSQLANVTLSAVSVDKAGEASGINNTFRQVGTSLGQALIGALLISALTTQLATDVDASKVLPIQAKPAITAEVAKNAQSLGAEQRGGQALPPQAAKEIVRIKNEAIVQGVRTALVAVIAVSALGLVLSIGLPKRAAQHAEDLSAAAH